MGRRTIAQGIALCALILGVAFGIHDTAGNQQGPGINDRLGNLDALCRLNGGTPGAYSTDTVVTRHYCKGGYLDGLYCDVYADLTYCYWDKVGKRTLPGGELPQVTTINQDLVFVSELPADSVSPLMPGVAGEPMLVEAVITWNPSADAAIAAGLHQVNACRLLGGEEAVAHAGDSQDATSFTTGCDGGLLNGMACSLGAGPTTCFFLPGTVPEGNTMASPMPPVDPGSTEDALPTTPPTTTAPVPTATASPTPTPTMPAPTPTDAPTEVPIEPTAPATTAGGPWSPPHDIGTLAPIEALPTDTPLPLT